LERRVGERTAELATANAGLRALSLQLVHVQESERRFLARELHDEFGQVLTGLKITLEQVLARAPGGLAEPLNQAVELVNRLVSQTRNLALQLRPPLLDDLGLLVALVWHFKQYRRQTNIAIDFRHTPVPERLPALLESAIFRVVQEALTNVARHASSTEAAVRLWLDRERIGVQVEDKGVGFDVNAAPGNPAASGLSGMKQRVELLGGEFTVDSGPGHGTRVTVELPLEAEPSADEKLG
jgi:signal transduction histidine kinase